MTKRLTLVDFIVRSQVVHDHLYDYSLVDYKGMHVAVTIRCSVHGSFIQTPNSHIRGASGCPICGKNKSHISQRLTTDEFVTNAIKVHNNKYDYSKTRYVTAKIPVTIICPFHGEYQQDPSNHLSGKGCKWCATRSKYVVNNQSDFIIAAKEVHDDVYDYSMVVYVNMNVPVTVICPIHGEFMQSPNRHLAGRGCTICGRKRNASKQRSNTMNFITKAMAVHNVNYEYANATYYNCKTKIRITCKNHGDFFQTPNDHLQGYGCPTCTHRISAGGYQWLNSLGILDDATHREVYGLVTGSRYSVDGYDPATKTVYEFLGDYWHGNPNVYSAIDYNPSRKMTFGDLCEQVTIRREQFLTAGYRMVEIWESDWFAGLLPTVYEPMM